MSSAGVRIYPTREQREADFVIRFCEFSQCLGDKNKTQLFKVTGATRENQGAKIYSFKVYLVPFAILFIGNLEVLINTEMDLKDDVLFSKLAGLDYHLHLKQVGPPFHLRQLHLEFRDYPQKYSYRLFRLSNYFVRFWFTSLATCWVCLTSPLLEP